MKIGDKVKLKKSVILTFKYKENEIYTVSDILETGVAYPIVLKNNNLGSLWYQCFSEEELINIKQERKDKLNKINEI